MTAEFVAGGAMPPLLARRRAPRAW